MSNIATTSLYTPYLKVSSPDLPQTLSAKLKFVKDKTKEFNSPLFAALSDEGSETHGLAITARLLKEPPSPRLNLDDTVTVF